METPLMIFNNPTEATENLIANTLLEQQRKTEGIIAVAGNGGSASQANHLAGELVPYRVPCIALTDIAVITSILNDFSDTEIFSKQIKAFSPQLSAIILLTTSGNSRNIQRALLEAHRYSIPIYLIMGNFNASAIKWTAESVGLSWKNGDNHLITYPGDTPQVQERTLKLIHKIYRINKVKHV